MICLSGRQEISMGAKKIIISLDDNFFLWNKIIFTRRQEFSLGKSCFSRLQKSFLLRFLMHLKLFLMRQVFSLGATLFDFKVETCSINQFVSGKQQDA